MGRKKRKEKTVPFGVILLTSPVLYRAAHGLRGNKVVLARPIVPPIASSLQRRHWASAMPQRQCSQLAKFETALIVHLVRAKIMFLSTPAAAASGFWSGSCAA